MTGLFHTVVNSLDDAVAWLVLADWLEDQGDRRARTARLEAQRLRHLRAGRPETAAARKAELDQLHEADQARLAASLGVPKALGGVIRPIARGGFVVGIQASCRARWDKPALIEALERDDNPLLCALILDQADQGLEELFKSPALERIRRLSWTNSPGRHWGHALVPLLECSPHVANVRQLEIACRNQPAGTASYERLFDPDTLPQLEDLSLVEDQRFATHGAGPLAAATHLRLRRLALHKAGLRHATLTTLATSPVLEAVRCIDLTDNPVGWQGVRALATSPYLDHLRVLSLVECAISDPAIEELVHGAFPRLDLLDIRGNRLTEIGLRRLGDASWASRVRTLTTQQIASDNVPWAG